MRALRVLLALAFVASLTMITAVTASATGGRPFSTSLNGAEEAPGPGDPDGSGWARITVNPGLGRVCYWLEVDGVAPIAASHIHVGDAGSPGPVVIPLNPPTAGSSSGCADVSRELAKALIQDPTHYYVNVHNADYPGGALRGQLGD